MTNRSNDDPVIYNFAILVRSLEQNIYNPLFIQHHFLIFNHTIYTDIVWRDKTETPCVRRIEPIIPVNQLDAQIASVFFFPDSTNQRDRNFVSTRCSPE